MFTAQQNVKNFFQTFINVFYWVNVYQ